uniref:Uncharacterized protein n=1 Tax=Amphimedon queenslandica TaxID=400682 RepID=A0A1X7TAF9_AMPQE
MQMTFFSYTHYLFIPISPLQSDLDIITSWFYSNCLSVNPSKSKYMFFSLKRQQSFDSLSFLLLSNVPFCLLF